MPNKFPGKPIPLTPEDKSTKLKESRAVVIPRFETFLYELHCILRNNNENYNRTYYSELNKFLENNSK